MLDWTAEIVGRMHAAGVTGKELAAEMGVSNTYLSTVLHNKKGNDETRKKVFAALEKLESDRTAIANV